MLGHIVFQVTIRAALTRLVSLILLGTHCHDVLDAALNDRAIKVIDAEDKLEEVAELALGVVQDVLKTEEVDGFVCCLSHLQPVIKPQFVTMCAPLLEVFPPRKNGHLSHLLLELTTVALRHSQVVERWVSIKLVSGAHESDIRLPVFLEWEHVREMRLVNPCPLVNYTLSFESAELKSHVGCMPHDHIRASRRPCDVLEVLAH